MAARNDDIRLPQNASKATIPAPSRNAPKKPPVNAQQPVSQNARQVERKSSQELTHAAKIRAIQESVTQANRLLNVELDTLVAENNELRTHLQAASNGNEERFEKILEILKAKDGEIAALKALLQQRDSELQQSRSETEQVRESLLDLQTKLSRSHAGRQTVLQPAPEHHSIANEQHVSFAEDERSSSPLLQAEIVEAEHESKRSGRNSSANGSKHPATRSSGLSLDTLYTRYSQQNAAKSAQTADNLPQHGTQPRPLLGFAPKFQSIVRPRPVQQPAAAADYDLSQLDAEEMQLNGLQAQEPAAPRSSRLTGNGNQERPLPNNGPVVARTSVLSSHNPALTRVEQGPARKETVYLKLSERRSQSAGRERPKSSR